MSEILDSQREVLDMNTILSTMSGLAVRYHREIDRVTRAFIRVSEFEDELLAPGLSERAKKYRLALTAEVPIAFSLEPSNMAVSVKVNKINPEDGNIIDGSDYQVGLVGGLAGDGSPSKPFNEDDLQLAIERLREQKISGLVYGLPDGSGFLEDY